ncbi:MAG: gas vesicle protein GvpD P-loop domain-containing protein [Candidatus Nitrosocaldus sp.]
MQSREDEGKGVYGTGNDNNNNSNAIRIAGSELRNVFRDFLNMEPTSMLIRGLPGTGKTTLALELMQLMHEKYNCFYISTRVSLARLQRYFPWIIGYLKDESVFSYDKIEKDSVIDLRLGSATGTVELVIDMLINKKRAFVVLDSWDALAKEIKYEDRMKMEKTMITVADTNDGFLLFVSEEPEMNTLSYLVDGIVTLSIKDDDGVSIRSMHLDKMRGVALYNSTYTYTLLESRFTLVPMMQYNSTYYGCKGCDDGNNGDGNSSSSSSRLFKPLYARAGFVSTGSKDTDNILHGGLEYGSTLLLEIDPGLDMVFLKTILVCMILNMLRSNGKVMLDALDAPVSSMLSSILPFCTDEVKNLTVFSSSKVDTSRIYEQWMMMSKRKKDGKGMLNTLPSIVNINDSNYMHIMLEKYVELKRVDGASSSDGKNDDDHNSTSKEMANTAKPLLLLLDRIHANDSRIHEGMLLTSAKDNGDVAVIVERMGSNNLPYAKSISDVHLRLWSRNGVCLMHSAKPSLGTYAILLDRERGYPAYSLLRMV